MASAAALAKQKEAEALGGAEAAAAEALLSASTSAAPAPPDPERHEAAITNPHGETLVHHLTIVCNLLLSFTRLNLGTYEYK